MWNNHRRRNQHVGYVSYVVWNEILQRIQVFGQNLRNYVVFAENYVCLHDLVELDEFLGDFSLSAWTNFE